MKAVSFMYVRPPGYNAESAKAAEIAEEMKKQEPSQDPTVNGASTSMYLLHFFFFFFSLASHPDSREETIR